MDLVELVDVGFKRVSFGQYLLLGGARPGFGLCAQLLESMAENA